MRKQDRALIRCAIKRSKKKDNSYSVGYNHIINIASKYEYMDIKLLCRIFKKWYTRQLIQSI